MSHLSCSKEKATSCARFRCERQGMYGVPSQGVPRYAGTDVTTILTQQLHSAGHLQHNSCAVEAGSP